MKRNNKKLKKTQKDVNSGNKILINKPISNICDDYIGVSTYVDTLKEAINQGCNTISISSGYGGGKSSVCKILSNSKEFNKVSTISLWDVTLENKEEIFKGKDKKREMQKNIKPEEIEFSDDIKKVDVLSFYTPFLFQLASDYSDTQYAKYINKSLNKSVGLIGVYLKKGKLIRWLISIFIFVSIYFLVDGIDKVNLPCIQIFFDYIKIDFNLKLIKYLALFIAGIILIFMLKDGKILYSSWKAEKNRLLTIEDVVLLYVEIINDSISAKEEKKNIIIIEDIDRCIKIYGDQIIRDFIKSIAKLTHYDCENKKLKKKLNNIVFIFCLDETQFIKNNELEEFLKIFDYRLDIGIIYHENYTHIFNELLNKVEIDEKQKNEIQILLDNKKNNIRLLKNEINDALLKFHLLKERYADENVEIDFKGCVAYAFLKNNFPNDFYNMINDSTSKIKINQFLDQHDVVNKSIELSNIKNDEFISKLADFFNKNYLDEQYILYLYNYPKKEKFLNIYEYQFNQYIKGLKENDLENNKKLSYDYIKYIASENNRIKRKYPDDILFDSYVFQNLISINQADEMLRKLLSEKILLNSKENIDNSISFINFCIQEKICKEYLFFYLEFICKNNWRIGNIIICPEFYMFREKLTIFFKDKIINFKNLFSNEFESIKMEEYRNINDKSLVYNLINTLHFNNDLEDIILEISSYINQNERYNLCKFWAENINDSKKFVNYTVNILNENEKFDEYLLKKLSNYREELKNSKEIRNYINKIVSNGTYSELSKINNMNISFGLDDDSIMIFLKNDFGLTPLIYLLYNEKYEVLTSTEFNFKDRFNTLRDEKYDYLTTYIIEFKKYILYNKTTSKYDYLFNNEYKKYDVDVNWKEVKNIHLLVLNFINDEHKLGEVIKDRILVKEELEKLLHELNMYGNVYSDIINDMIIYLINQYKEFCKDISTENDIIYKLIEKRVEPIKSKLVIYYYINCNQLDKKYYTNIKNYNGEEKKLYAEYINGLDNAEIIDEMILSLNIIYPYNEYIIKKLEEHKMYKYVIGACLLGKIKYNLKNSFVNIADTEFKDLFNYSEDFKIAIMSDNLLYKKVIALNLFGEITTENLITAFERFSYNKSIVKEYLENINDSMLTKILFGFSNLTVHATRNIIDVLFSLDNCQKLIINNVNIYNHLYNNIAKNYKGLFTRKFNQVK